VFAAPQRLGLDFVLAKPVMTRLPSPPPFTFVALLAVAMVSVAVWADAHGAKAQGCLSTAASADPLRRGTGSGFVVDSRGAILTNYHVAAGCGALRVRHGNAVIPVKLAAVDARADLAVLLPQRPMPLRPAVFRRGAAPLSGEPVVVAGFPREVLDRGWLKAVTGKVTALDQRVEGHRFMRISAAVGPGTSGGPVLDRAGRVIGVVTGMLHARATGMPIDNPGLAVPGDAVQRFLRSVGVAYSVAEGVPADTKGLAASAAAYTVLVECGP
jgi:S1-C subfamily serine protease